jgi:hypothetical protein
VIGQRSAETAGPLGGVGPDWARIREKSALPRRVGPAPPLSSAERGSACAESQANRAALGQKTAATGWHPDGPKGRPRGSGGRLASAELRPIENRHAGAFLRNQCFRSRISEGGFSPRYCCLTSIVNCPGPADFAVQVYDVPASAAKLPIASFSSPFPEAVNPVTLPSVIVSASVPPVF